ncbi:c-type cytochrome [Thioalkalivibrio thiocyanodenitrificans]|uniref:c-type cytochrome n=1 Tax=Thioalkalivibrio thiocyanodenitrificans TaxID=243063 RepID=UPI0003759E94|nr:c-type cytochrome [Thioalkalivibrio thiocyanodenitrificans]
MIRCIILTALILGAFSVQAEHGPHALPGELLSAYEALRAEVENDPDALERVIAEGRGRAVFCNACHGPDGNARRPNYPSLAGQNPVYLLDQIEQFASHTREKRIMNDLAETFSTEEKVVLALYYANMELEPIADLDTELARAGAGVYEARCAQCHGDQGLGEQGYARIAGQSPSYVANVLKAYRSGESPRRPSAMFGVARGLSETDVDAVAHYVAALR